MNENLQQLHFLLRPRFQTALIDGQFAVFDNMTEGVEWCANYATARFLADDRNNKEGYSVAGY